MCSCSITWQTKNVISLLVQYLWPANMAKWWHTLRSSPLIKLLHLSNTWFLRSRDMLNFLYLHLHLNNCHTHGKVLTEGEKLRLTCVYESLYYKLKTYLLHDIANGHKIYYGMANHKELPLINLDDPLMRWSCQAMWQSSYISPPAQNSWTPNKAKCWCTVRDSHP